MDVTNPEIKNAIAHKLAGGYYHPNGTKDKHSDLLVHDWYS